MCREDDEMQIDDRCDLEIQIPRVHTAVQIFGVIRGRDSETFSLYLIKYPDSTWISNLNFAVSEPRSLMYLAVLSTNKVSISELDDR